MKKVITLILSLLMLCIFSPVSFGALTIFISGSDSMTKGYYTSCTEAKYSSGMKAGVFILTYIGTFKISFENYSGVYKTTYFATDTKGDIGVNNLELGFPVFTNDKVFFYVVMGPLNRRQDNTNSSLAEYRNELNANMLGIDCIYTLTDWLYLEASFQQPFLGARYKEDSGANSSSLKLNSLKLKTQLILTDKLGLILYYHNLDIDMAYILGDGITIGKKTFNDEITALGIVYRF